MEKQNERNENYVYCNIKELIELNGQYQTVVDELINNKCDISKLDINVATRIQPSKIIKIS